MRRSRTASRPKSLDCPFCGSGEPFLVIPPIIGEVWMVIYLLVIGVKTVKPDPDGLLHHPRIT